MMDFGSPTKAALRTSSFPYRIISRPSRMHSQISLTCNVVAVRLKEMKIWNFDIYIYIYIYIAT